MRSIESAVRLARSRIDEEHRKVIKFVLAGGFKVAVGYALYLLMLWAGFHHRVALAGDYLLGLAVGYVLAKSWTFTNQGRARAALLKYLVAFVLVYFLEVAALDLAIAFGMDTATGRIPSLVFATAVSYVLQRYWVFKGHPDEACGP